MMLYTNLSLAAVTIVPMIVAIVIVMVLTRRIYKVFQKQLV